MGDIEVEEVQTFVEGAVAAADHEHASAFVWCSVADGAEVELIAFGGHIQWYGLAVRGKDERRSLPDRAVFSAYDFFVAFQLQPGDFKDLFDIDAQLVDVPAYVLHQLHAVDFRIRREVFHRVRRVDQAPGHVGFEQGHAQVGALRIERRRHSGGDTSEDQYIVKPFPAHAVLMLCW